MNRICTLLFLLISFFVSAQSIDWKESAELKGKVVDLLGSKLGLRYVITSSGSNFYLEGIQSDGIVKFSNKLKFPRIDGKDQRFIRAYMVKGEITILGLLDDFGTSKISMISNKVNQEGVVVGGSSKLFSVNAEKYDVSSEFHIEFSSDSSKVVMHHDTPFNDGKNVRSSYVVLNGDFTVITSSFLLFDKKKQDIFILDYAINNDGDIAVVKDHYDLIGTNIEKQNISIHLLNKEGSEIAVKELNLGNKFIQVENIEFIGSGLKEVIYTGFYKKLVQGEKNSAMVGDDRLNGFYVSRFGNNLSSMKEQTNEFSTSQYKMFMDDKNYLKQMKKGVLGIDVFQRGDLILKDMIITDQGITIVSEFEKDNGVSRVFGDIVILQIDSYGKMKWMKRIPKSQTHTSMIMGDGAIDYKFDIFRQMEKSQKTSYILGSNYSGITILYYGNAGDENLNEQGFAKTMTSYKKVPLIRVNIDYAGNIKKYMSVDFSSSLTMSKRYGDTEFLIFKAQKKMTKFGVLKM